MRTAASVTSISWVPFGSLDALPAIPLAVAMAHYDEPPPESLAGLESLRRAGAFRLVNELRAWVDADDGRISGFGYDGGGVVAEPDVEADSYQVSFAGVDFPVIRAEPTVGDGWVRFTQTVGGRIGLPLPRPIRGKPYPHLEPAAAWTTLALKVFADGSSRALLVGASPFPSHWLYDDRGRVVERRPTIDLAGWYEDAFDEETPWGADAADAAASELERALGRRLRLEGTWMQRRNLRAGEVLVEQGDPGDVLYLLLIGALDVEVDGVAVARVGAGAIVGELAVLRDGRRTATLRAATASRVAVVPGHRVDRGELRRLALTRGSRR
ncbi:MAG: cyclic nucleotide-binding domain-containing protein [Thermoleophilia bacterium]|nr:cyclic nucleotide-binding domain-containing protein [Thermoleophilia bacterium]